MALTLPRMWALVELSDLCPARQSVVLSPPAGGGLREHWLGGVCPNSQAPSNTETSPGKEESRQKWEASRKGEKEVKAWVGLAGEVVKEEREKPPPYVFQTDCHRDTGLGLVSRGESLVPGASQASAPPRV